MNHAPLTFLDPAARDFWTDWERAADDSVASCDRAAATPTTRPLPAWWANCPPGASLSHPVGRPQRPPAPPAAALPPSVVGDLHLNFEAMELPADPGLSFLAFSAPAGSPDDEPSASSPAGPPPTT